MSNPSQKSLRSLFVYSLPFLYVALCNAFATPLHVQYRKASNNRLKKGKTSLLPSRRILISSISTRGGGPLRQNAAPVDGSDHNPTAVKTKADVDIIAAVDPDFKINDKSPAKIVDVNVTSVGPMPEGNFLVPPQPTLLQLRNFAIPCLGLWISGPLLSLVDTATVGLSAAQGTGAAQLGALGPATTFIDGANYLFAFLNVATTNLYASALARNFNKGNKERSSPRTAGDGVVRTATKISLICGFFIMGVLLKFGMPLLKIYIGPEAAETVLAPAFSYVWIRALSMPTSLLSGVLQAALLGAKDSITPLIAVAWSTVFNVVGDYLCVVEWGMGSKGAAIATLVAQWAGTIAMLGPAKRKLIATKEEKSVQMTKIDNGKVTSKAFLSFAAPVLTLILGKIAAFGVMTHVAAALPGAASLAAHQVILSLFFFVSPFLEVISQTAQTFLPQYYTPLNDKDTSPANAVALNEAADTLARRLLRLSLVIALVLAFVAASIPRFLPHFLTNDAMVQASIRPLAGPLALGALLTAPVAVSEGILLARRELKYLTGVYVLSTAVFPFALFTIKKAQGSVVNVWVGFAAFQLFRAVCFTGRLWGPKVWNSLASGKRKISKNEIA